MGTFLTPLFIVENECVCPTTSQPITHTYVCSRIPPPKAALLSSVFFFTTQLSKSSVRSSEPAVAQWPSARPSGPGGTKPHESTWQQPQ